MKRVGEAFIAISVLALASACVSRPDNFGFEDGAMAVTAASSAAQGSASSGPYNCASSPNVKPDYDWNMDGTGFYTVCPRADSEKDIQIKGGTHDSDQICVFPVEYKSRSEILTDASLGYCIDIQPDVGVYASFEVSFNAVFIVEGPDFYQMADCLERANYYLCPHYSYGKFR